MFGRKPPQNPHSYIVVLDTGAHWADEFGVIKERVADGTFHRVLGSDNSHFAEAVLLASMMHARLSSLEARIADLSQDLRVLGGGAASEAPGGSFESAIAGDGYRPSLAAAARD